MKLEEAVHARRSIRAFDDRPVPEDAVLRAIGLAVQAPAPHHSSPWRFALLHDSGKKENFSRAMGEAWRGDLESDGMASAKIEGILQRSHRLLSATPLIIVACADMAKAHDYPDERRRRAEWSLFAHSVGAALQTLMLALAEDGIGSCWISAPVFCGDTVRSHLQLDDSVEPQALVLAGYPSPEYRPRPRGPIDPRRFIAPGW